MNVKGFGRLRMAVAVLLPVWCATSCTRQSGAGQVRLLPTSTPYERDIPVPKGFTLIERATEDRATGQQRLYLRHVYRGRADRYAVRNFYREQMPLARWMKVSDGNIRGEYTLRFEKGTESCTVVVRGAGAGGWGSTDIQVLVAQEQRGNLPPVRREQP